MKDQLKKLNGRLTAFGLNPTEWCIEVINHQEGYVDLRLSSNDHDFTLEGRAYTFNWLWLRMVESEAA